ncbi:shikimate dehydrogenase [Bartonella tamiae]|uniref:Shikimate dehydrogenase (NADP(+)) n=1 Tax=Bartonella tamiae Th239 TaxID=1094558 RepID=J0ZQQ5_9HYPH|nr:shikimate dehydrogenase [Bartonella tamiae]EJF90983.1 shikimate 5-dehydrogenase [Bartonella tamiae Th239]EJF93352.1 shikimate 5-dehydrogenase [Bartonella tamiae Th307]
MDNCETVIKLKGPKAFVVGYPIGHSRSPHIHQTWLERYQCEGSYESLEITPQYFPKFLKNLKKHQFCGGNVTLPHKHVAFQIAEKKDDVSIMIGAANTLWYENEILCAGNTDAYGFSKNLDDYAPGWAGDVAIVLGAGGASRAVIYALKKRGFERIYLYNRTFSRAQELVDHFGAPLHAYEWQKRQEFLPEADLIVNTTPLGMTTSPINSFDITKNKQSKNSLNSTTFDHDDMSFHSEQTSKNLHYDNFEALNLIDFDSAKSSLLVTDIVYTPLQTPFLCQAQAYGLKTVDGLGMLLHQAVPGFEHWFGIKPKVDDDLRMKILRNIR